MTTPPIDPTTHLDGDDAIADRLRRELRVTEPVPSADWSDLTTRIDRRNRRSQRLTMAVAAMVAILTGLGGFYLGNRSETVTLKSEKSDQSLGVASGVDAAPPSTVMSGDVMQSPAMGADGYGGGQASKLISRDTAGGLTLRVTRNDFPDGQMGMVPNGVGAYPDECIQTGNLNIFVVGPDDVGTGWAQISKATRPYATLSMSSSTLGESAWIVTVTGAADGQVSATFPGGATDAMSAVNGIAVLAAPAKDTSGSQWKDVKIALQPKGAAATPLTPETVQIMNAYPMAAGDVSVSGGDFPGNLPGSASDFTNVAPDCSPKLPAPGEQPADVEAARAAISAAFTKVYKFDTPIEEKQDSLTGTDGVQAALDAVLKGGFAAAAKGASWKLTDMVFTAPDTAVVKYDILIPPESGAQSVASNRFGMAKFVDGHWKVTRDTICADLNLAGGNCDTPGGGQYPIDSREGFPDGFPGASPTTVVSGTATPAVAPSTTVGTR